MAQTSITIPISKLYECLYSGSNYKYYYRNLDQSYLVLHNAASVTSDMTRLYVGLQDMTATLGRHLLYKLTFNFRIVAPYDSASSASISADRLKSPLPNTNPGSTYIEGPGNDATPAGPWKSVYSSSKIPEPGANTLIETYLDSESARDKSYFTYLILKYQVFCLRASSGQGDVKVYSTLLNGNSPTVTIYYDDSEIVSRSISSVSGITSGYWNPRDAHTIGWALAVDSNNAYYSLVTDIIPVHETLYWKESNAESWTSISIPDGASSYSVPANTFPVGNTINWYVSVTDQDGVTSTSSTYTVTTDDSTSTATPTAPINSVEIGNEPVLFTWAVTNPSGAAPSRVKAEWATAADAAEWTELFDVNEAIYSFEAPSGTFPGGNIYWRVTSYNQDSEAGPTSDPVVFSCIAPPAPPTNVTATNAPFSTISWQSTVQTAFEILIDGKSVAQRFGNDVYNYTLSDPLDDGVHTIGVRLQGPYGYWSNVTSTVVTVENQGTGTITLDGRFAVDGNLTWETTNTDEGKVYRIYRDEKLIGRTANEYFIDRFVLGEHKYSVLAELPGGNYIRSAVITGVMKSCTMRIAPAAGGDWLELKLTENSNGAENFEWNRNVTLRHYAGSAYPVAEFSPYENRSASYDCAFTTVQEAKAFEQMQGQIVVLKSRGGEVMTGPLNPVSKTTNTFYIAYRFSVQMIHWEDFIDDTVS